MTRRHDEMTRQHDEITRRHFEINLTRGRVDSMNWRDEKRTLRDDYAAGRDEYFVQELTPYQNGWLKERNLNKHRDQRSSPGLLCTHDLLGHLLMHTQGNFWHWRQVTPHNWIDDPVFVKGDESSSKDTRLENLTREYSDKHLQWTNDGNFTLSV